jgi:hypothetical protein
VSTAEDGRMTGNRALTAAIIVVGAFIAGPLLAALFVFLGMGGLLIADTGGHFVGLWQLFITIVQAVFRGGWPVALFSGVLVAIWSLKRPLSLWVVLAAIIIANLIDAVLFLRVPLVAGGWTLSFEELIGGLLFSLLAGTILWLMARRYVRNA